MSIITKYIKCMIGWTCVMSVLVGCVNSKQEEPQFITPCWRKQLRFFPCVFHTPSSLPKTELFSVTLLFYLKIKEKARGGANASVRLQ